HDTRGGILTARGYHTKTCGRMPPLRCAGNSRCGILTAQAAQERARHEWHRIPHLRSNFVPEEMQMATTMSAPRTTARQAQKTWRSRRLPWLFVAPSLLIVLLVTIFPTLYSFYLSFFRWEPTIPNPP